ncbi:MAG: permease [Chitinophagaceae bacterium]|nr:permease [Chitinophagaceae bacterium]
MSQAKPFYEKTSHILLSVVLLGVILHFGQEVLEPLAFSMLFAILLMSPGDYLEKRGLGRIAASLITVLLSVIILAVVFYFISSQILRLKDEWPSLVKQLQDILTNIGDWLHRNFSMRRANVKKAIQATTSTAMPDTSSLITNTFNFLSGTLLEILLVIIYTFLLLLYRGLVVQFFIKCFDETFTPLVKDILSQIRYVIKSYVTGLFIEMSIVALLNCTSFLILGVKYALLLGIMAALMNVIPYLGIFAACILSVLITMTTTDSGGTVAGVAITLYAVHLIDSNFLLPRIVGSKVKINALVTILSVVVGSLVWGVKGMFLAIPFTAIVKVIFDSVTVFYPWGILLGEDITMKPRSGKMLQKISVRLRKKERKENLGNE